MRILDINGVEIVNPDYSLGYLIEEKIIKVHHEAVEAVEEQGHYETVAEYPNGGKDVAWIVDVEGIEGKEAWDEYEDIQRFVEFTEKEIAQHRIDELKSLLSSTDYKIIKLMEGAITQEEIADDIKSRAAYRKEINELEELLTKEE